VSSYVIDSWPILEWLLNKAPAAAHFEQFVDQAIAAQSYLVMSRMNYGEVIYSLAKPLPNPRIEALLLDMRSLPITILSVDDALVDEAALLKSRYAISYADCFAAALAIRMNAAVVTGDPEFLHLRDQGLINLEWMGA
jgi:predicted nucleic acid-binding protein